MKKCLVFVAFLLLVPLAFAQTGEIKTTLTGSCQRFTLEITAPLEGCWDVKIDSPGYLDYGGQRKNSFFYVPDALCNGSGLLQIDFADRGDFYSTLKLRNNSTLIEKTLFVDQKCSPPIGNDDVVLMSMLIAAVLVTVVFWYREHA